MFPTIPINIARERQLRVIYATHTPPMLRMCCVCVCGVRMGVRARVCVQRQLMAFTTQKNIYNTRSGVCACIFRRARAHAKKFAHASNMCCE